MGKSSEKSLIITFPSKMGEIFVLPVQSILIPWKKLKIPNFDEATAWLKRLMEIIKCKTKFPFHPRHFYNWRFKSRFPMSIV